MNRLWAPWRAAYLKPKRRNSKKCVFCALLKDNRDARHYILKRTSLSFAILNRYPYANGHVLILPRRHVAELAKLTPDEKLDWLGLLGTIQLALRKVLAPQGFNVGLNIGRVSGAGIPGHLHMHIVPRWDGDVNFMPVLAHTKVISQSLDEAYQQLSEFLADDQNFTRKSKIEKKVRRTGTRRSRK